MSRRGIGYSWGIPGFRISNHADGSTWVSAGIPGTGLYYTKRLNNRTNQIPPHPTQDQDQEAVLRQYGIKKWKDLTK